MDVKKQILLILFLITNTIVFAQTAGFNYQALILSDEKIQIPGTDVTKSNVPLISEEVVIRFTINSEETIEYVEEHTVFTDEFGMISLIVGDGKSINSSFKNIIWNGKPKYLDVELKVLKDDDDFTLIDSQKILHIPSPNTTSIGSGNGSIKIIRSLDELSPPFTSGELVWITNYGENNNTTLLIWNGTNWLPVNQDYDVKNELGLVVVPNNLDRSAKFPRPKPGDVIWNRTCKCIQVYDNNGWSSVTTNASNGLTLTNGNVKLGGLLTEPTVLETSTKNTLAIKGLQNATNSNNQLVVVDKDGILKQISIESIVNQTQVKEHIIYAKDGQIEFNIPLEIKNTHAINVYRNGINIDFTILNKNTIKLEKEAKCYENDKIRIVQIY